MKKLIVLLALLVLVGWAVKPVSAQTLLKQSTATTVNFKLTKIADGTDDTGATVTSITVKLAKHSDTSSNSSTSITCAASGSSNDCVHVAAGLWNLELTASNTDTLGRLDICASYSGDYTDCTRYQVIPAATYDFMVSTGPASAPTNFSLLSISGAGVVEANAATIAANAITASTIAADAIGASQIAAGAITSAEIAADAIGASEIADAALDAGAFAADAITAAKLASDVATELQNGLQTLKKNTAFTSFYIKAITSAGVAVTGATPSCQVSRDSAALSGTGVSNNTEVGNGVYSIDFTSGALNGNALYLRCTFSGGSGTAVPYEQLIFTQR